MSKKLKCKNCGEKITENTRICPYCDTEINPKKPKKRRAMKIFVVLIWIILILAIIASALWSVYTFAFRSYDCEELLSVNFDGSNKSAIGYVTLNEDNSLFTATETGKDNTPLLSDVYDTDTEKASELQTLLVDSIYIADDPRDETYKTEVNGKIYTGTSLSKRENIKNGDVITVTVSYDKWGLFFKGIRLENTEFDIKVSGLTTSSTIDPFEGLNYIFTGVEGYGKVTLDTSGCSSLVANSFEYSVSPSTYLSEGDEITVTATYTGKTYDDESGTIEYDGKYYSCQKESTKTVTVTTLSSTEVLDPFENVTIEYDGIDPFLSISGYDTSQANKVISTYFEFEASKSENLKAGDVITVTAVYKTVDDKQYTDKDLESAGYTLLKTEHTYTVPDEVAKYAKKSSSFNQNKVSKSFTSALSAYMTGENKVKLVRCYFGLRKSSDTSLAYNKYYEIYEVTVDSSKTYLVFSAENIYTDEDGNLNFSVNIYDESSPNISVMKSKYVDTDKTDYKISEVDVPESPVNNFNITTTTTTTTTTAADESSSDDDDSDSSESEE
ncbi:MAG: zinc ribbon domain-containing protein [Ruminococcus sp.]|nr:zinc ribbon domain-containing protein [Ruminococcus sp.]